ncbi:hypothetical protein AB0G02_19800 [Actinosynnema sp. NPDC023658]|uniref:hypothetical protein n=1 Tax=Actinosynnema sp. NPDC023658 TaxID=3155465 RepID=UPI0034020E8A
MPDGSVLRTAVVGVDGSTAVVRLATGNSRTGDGSVGTLAVDLAAREAAWVQSGLDPLAVVGGLVAGLLDDPRDQALQARRVADGSTVWSKDVEAAQAVPAGPELLLVHGLRGREFGAVTGVRVVDGGEVDVRLPAKARGLPRYCAHDGRSVAVCVNSTVFGLDPASGEVLWSLADDPDRLPLRVTGAWHGLVYGDTGRNGPVVLDARTGEDVGTSPGAAPYWTDGRYAVTDDEVVPVTG